MPDAPVIRATAVSTETKRRLLDKARRLAASKVEVSGDGRFTQSDDPQEGHEAIYVLNKMDE